MASANMASTWVIADLHGNARALAALLAALPMRQRDTCVFLGDLVGSCGDSAIVLRAFAALNRRHCGRCYWLPGGLERALSGSPSPG